MYVPMLLFLVSPAALMWALSERREGRDVWPPLVAIELGLSALGTLWLLNSGRISNRHVPFMLAAVLLWCLSFVSGSSGGADHMLPYYSVFGLSAEQTLTLILWSRKLVHVVFYSTMANLWYAYFIRTNYVDWTASDRHDQKDRDQQTLPQDERRPAVQVALELTAIVAICDEWRQNMMPNREGSYRDVLLDLGAATIWLWWRYLRTNSAKQEAPSSDSQT